jgi:hypothetical protein
MWAHANPRALANWRRAYAAALLYRRLPPHVRTVPPHLQQFAGYLPESVHGRLALLQHDEKDIDARDGPEGMQDYDDGERKRLLEQLSSFMQEERLAAKQACEAAGAAVALPVEHHQVLVKACIEIKSRLASQRQKAELASASIEENLAKATTDQASATGNDHERLARKIGRLAARKSERDAVFGQADRVLRQLTTDLRLKTAAGLQLLLTLKPSELLAIFIESERVHASVWQWSNLPASKVLLCVLSSLLTTHDWALRSWYATHETTTVAQVRECLLRATSELLNDEILCVGWGADKAYTKMGHHDLEGCAPKRSPTQSPPTDRDPPS